MIYITIRLSCGLVANLALVINFFSLYLGCPTISYHMVGYLLYSVVYFPLPEQGCEVLECAHLKKSAFRFTRKTGAIEEAENVPSSEKKKRKIHR